jgi:hypothetical protein
MFLACKKLSGCGNSYLVRYFNWEDDVALASLIARAEKRPRPRLRLLQNPGEYVEVEIAYAELALMANVAARVTPSMKRISAGRYFVAFGGDVVSTCLCGTTEDPRLTCHRTVDGRSRYWWLGQSTEAVSFTVERGEDKTYCFREELMAKIEVFPEVFLRRRLWIGAEQRWARTPVEATVYLILHEMGHLESFLRSTSVMYKFVIGSSKPPSSGNSEADAWEYASSAIRCSN